MKRGIGSRAIAFACTALSCTSAHAHAGGLEIVVFFALVVGAVFGTFLALIPRRFVRTAIAAALLASGISYVASFSKEPYSFNYVLELLSGLVFAIPLALLPAALVAFGTYAATRSVVQKVTHLRRHLKVK